MSALYKALCDLADAHAERVPHPQAAQLAQAHEDAQQSRFKPTPAEYAAAVSDIKRSMLDRVEVMFMDTTLVCFGTYSPNVDFCDDGGFELDRAEHKGEDIKDLLSADYQQRLEEACFFEYEREAS